MGCCASKPKELDDPSTAALVKDSAAEPEVTMKHGDAVAPQEDVEAENPVENNESKEAPLVDLSSTKAEAKKIPVVELAFEISELKADIEPVKVEVVVAKEDMPAPASAPVIEEKEKEAAAEKVEEVKEHVLMVDEKKVSA